MTSAGRVATGVLHEILVVEKQGREELVLHPGDQVFYAGSRSLNQFGTSHKFVILRPKEARDA